MRKLLTCVVIGCLLWSACSEEPVVIPPLGPQSTGDRVVVIEEFTGVKCVNCPQGSDEIRNLSGLFGDNLAVISIHAGFFSTPYSDSRYDLRTPEGNQIIQQLGVPLGYPSAVVNRKQFAGKANLQLGQAEWAGAIREELNNAPQISLSLEKNYDAASRVLRITAVSVPLENISGSLRLSVALTEDGVVDKQLTPEGEKADYAHQHVLRIMPTGAEGQALGSLIRGVAQRNTFEWTMPQEWDVEKCKVVAFVHRAAPEKAVLQAAQVAVLE